MIFYTYLGYYLTLFIFSIIIRSRPLIYKEEVECPEVSILIAAYNEEKNIYNKIENILSSNYPQNKLIIFVVSDASTDQTNKIVSNCGYDNVNLIISPKRQGKTICENLALKQISSELVVFTDASVMLEKNCIRNLARHFQFNEEVGCVSTYDKSIESDTNKGEGLYVKYEMAIRSFESKLCSLVGLSGSCYAARRQLCTELPGYVTRDFALPLIAMERGFISMDDPEAICYVKAIDDSKREFKRKVRTFTNGISTLIYKSNLLNIFRYRIFSFILWSHKVFRWLLPVFFVLLFLANCFLIVNNSFYKFFLFCQIFFYFSALFGGICNSVNIFGKFSKICHFVCMTNIASIIAWYHFLHGKKWATWEPTKRI